MHTGNKTSEFFLYHYLKIEYNGNCQDQCGYSRQDPVMFTLVKLHGTKLDTLNVGGIYVDDLLGWPLKVRPGLIPSALTGFLSPISYGKIICSALIQRGGAWFCLNLGCQTLRPHLR